MQESGWTIIVLAYNAPNRLAVSLRSLAKYSELKHDILIVWSDPERIAQSVHITPTARSGHWDTEELSYRGPRPLSVPFLDYGKYVSVREFLSSQKNWLDTQGIRHVELTEENVAFREDYLAGRIVPDYRWVTMPNPESSLDFRYVDVSFHINRAMELARGEWYFVTWDDDCFASPGWDMGLWKATQEYGPGYPYAPTCVLYWPFWADGTVPPFRNRWEDLRTYNCNSIFYTDPAPVTPTQWEQFVEETRQPGEIYYDRCGDRLRSPALPHLIHASLARTIGPHIYSGQANDIEIDDRCRDQYNLYKISCRDSLMAHKVPISYRAEWI